IVVVLRGGSLTSLRAPISAISYSGGDAGNVHVDVDGTIALRGHGSGIRADTRGGGNAHVVDVRAGAVELYEGAIIGAGSYSGGNAGTVTVTAERSIRVDDAGGPAFSLNAILDGTSWLTGIFSATIFGGNSGLVAVDAPDVIVTNGGGIATSTVGGGAAGNVE